jgi:L-threonylcarbamoyladenylate synthase
MSRDGNVDDRVSHNGTIAVRLPRSAVAVRVAELFGGAVVATSANISGQPPIASIAEAARLLHGLDMVVDTSDRQLDRPSTIFDLPTMRVTRRGTISDNEITRTMG